MNKVLVTYFSASGETKKVAEMLAISINSDIFEIKPKIPYTTEDLDWQNSQSRSSIEMQDKSSRPEILEKLENMDQYNVVFVGFPIWWYREPSIIDTFIEQYDFTGKTIIPFATSGSSSIGDSGQNIQVLAKGAKVNTGKRFPTNVSASELKSWASEWV